MNLIRTLGNDHRIFIVLGIGTLSCEKTDKALETLDKAKNLHRNMEKKAGVQEERRTESRWILQVD